MTITGEMMFNFHERSNVALEEQKWSSACTHGDDEESDVQTQSKDKGPFSLA